MPSFDAVGYISFTPVARDSGCVTMTFAAPQIHQAATREVGRSQIEVMSSALRQSANEAHQLDLEDLTRRIDASRQLKDTIVSLKDRLARRVLVRAPLAVVDDTGELTYKAS